MPVHLSTHKVRRSTSSHNKGKSKGSSMNTRVPTQSMIDKASNTKRYSK